jgi:hypothetical protein
LAYFVSPALAGVESCTRKCRTYGRGGFFYLQRKDRAAWVPPTITGEQAHPVLLATIRHIRAINRIESREIERLRINGSGTTNHLQILRGGTQAFGRGTTILPCSGLNLVDKKLEFISTLFLTSFIIFHVFLDGGGGIRPPGRAQGRLGSVVFVVIG